MIQEKLNDLWTCIEPNEHQPTTTQMNELLHPALAAAGIGVWCYQPNIESIYIDDLLRDMCDLPSDGELSIAQIAERIHPSDRDAWIQAFSQPSSDGIVHTRHRIIVGDGTQRWLEFTGKSSPDSDNIIGICVDISDEIAAYDKADKAIVEQDRARALASGAPGQFSYIDRDYRIQFLSSDFRDLWKMGPDDYEQTIGRTAEDVFGEFHNNQRKELIEQAFQGELVTFEDTVAKDGKEKHHIVTYKPDIDDQGEVRGVFTMRTDITDRHRLEEELRELSEDLARSNTDLEQFAYVASHDLKAPLRSIQVLVEWLTEDLQGYEEGEVQENLDLLSQRTSRLNNLLEDLLSYSRAGRDTQPPIAVELGSMIGEIADMLNPNDSAVVRMCGEDITLQTDPAALHQVMRNLIGNAIKHHPGPDVEVLISAIDQGAHYEISVADNGHGIPEEFAARVFQMFQTLRPRDEVEGSGMGLAIVERIVHNQGGRIWLESSPADSGAVFKFTWKKRESR